MVGFDGKWLRGIALMVIVAWTSPLRDALAQDTSPIRSILGTPSGSPVQEPETAAQESAAAPRALQEPGAAAATDDPVYQIPLTDNPDEVMAFIDSLTALQPGTTESYRQHSKIFPQVLEAAARRVLELDTEPTSSRRRRAEYLIVVAHVADLPNRSVEDRQVVFDEVLARLQATPVLEQEAGIASQLAGVYETLGERDLAERAYREFGALIAKANQTQLAKFGRRLEGAARRMNLVGNTIEIRGTLLDGKEFDWSAYEGKVVLIDFWATWCGPCIRELPVLKDLYEQHHEAGFEIVAINLDMRGERVADFLQDEKIEWPCLFEENVGWDHPMAIEFGIDGIPATILVGRDGKVITLDARADRLGDLLPTVLKTP